MDIRRLFPFLYLWSPVYVGGSISDWPQLGLLCCLQPMVIYFWNETNELLEMATGASSFVTIGEEYVYIETSLVCLC